MNLLKAEYQRHAQQYPNLANAEQQIAARLAQDRP
jgi:hypothetical protein